MRPAKAAPVAPFANSPLRQHPNDCASDCRGIPDPVAPFKPPCLISQCTGGASAHVLSANAMLNNIQSRLFVENRYAAHKHQLGVLWQCGHNRR